ncbi:MAG TPA: formate/nitrite transporter family protein [Candidatus Sulfotelmatobacter sp.]|jgi:formate/nitrite transporter|nr:formate/nitrite transporter family protein [Candidatus Sulfotelmatobacter sp.]
MSDAPKSEIFGLDCYSPAQIQANVEKLGVKKATMPFLPSFMLSIVAGGSIGLGAMYFLIMQADPALSFALQRMLGGVGFSLGLLVVLVAGAELFTGNNLIVMAWANRQISLRAVLRNWVIVWLGNLVGSLGLAGLLYLAHTYSLNNDGFGTALLKVAVAKVAPDSLTIFVKGVLCNLLVCLAVWLAYAGRTVVDKVAAILLPVSAFVAAGFEHCVANQFFLPLALLLKTTGHIPTDLDLSVLTIGSVLHNLLFATLGNIVGGSLLVGAIYWIIYRKCLGGLYPIDNDKQV